MKKIFTFALLVISLISQGQDDRMIKERQASLSAPTEIGKPDGGLTSQKIGKDGGTLVSSDNKITLIIPAGALSSEILISIQPTTNLAKESMGKAYQLEPSGLQFQKPAQLVFYYTDAEMDGQSPQFMGIASQNEKGIWQNLEKVKVDTISKNISGEIRHFSGWALRWRLILIPMKDRMKVSTTTAIGVMVRSSEDIQPLPGEGLKANEHFFGPNNIYPRTWLVNGIPGGNAEVGIITSSGISALYEAPAEVPDQNPVLIILEIQGISDEYGTFTLRRACKILIIGDRYEVNMIATMKGGSIKEWGGRMTYRDEGSFTVTLDKKEPEVIDIKNKLEVLTYDNCPDRIITNPTTNTGLFHVAGTKQFKITAANPPGQPYRIVEIWFKQYPTELTRFTFNCPSPPGTLKSNSKGKVDLITSARGQPPPLLMFFGMPALPPYIKFIAKDEEQIIIEKGKPGAELYYKIWVKRIEGDIF